MQSEFYSFPSRVLIKVFQDYKNRTGTEIKNNL